ncbi:MAG: hypothetical protein H0X42_04105 [Solirubrobacterales bacterium]|nr:hypothetical protein [Solirubrobacterales bacterium]
MVAAPSQAATDVYPPGSGTGLLGGATSVRFDNVSLSVLSGVAGGSAGAGGVAGANLSSAQLQSLLSSGSGSLVGPAILKGNRIFVKAKCPKKVGRTCKVSVQGMLKKHGPATSSRTAKVGKGKTKRFVLQVKPKARVKVMASKRLLFKETVKAGKAKATVYKRLKLVKR